MFRSEVYGESTPKVAPLLFAEVVGQGLGAMRVEVVHDQMDGASSRVARCEVLDEASELRARAVHGSSGEMAACFRLYNSEDVCCTAALVLVVAFGG